MLELATMFFLFDFLSDMMLVLRIFVLLTIASFIMSHLGKGPVAVVLVAGLAYFMLSPQYFWFFGSVYVLMSLLLMGAAGILIDFFFVGGGSSGQAESPVSSGADLAKRVAVSQRGRNVAQGMMQRFRGR